MKEEMMSFDKEFKLMAVTLCLAGKSTGEVAKELGITDELVHCWKREYEQYNQGSLLGQGKVDLTIEQWENERLKRELKEAQEELEILKKAISIFSKGDGRCFN